MAFPATNDIDVVAKIVPSIVEDFCAAVSLDFYIDSGEVRHAIWNGRPSKHDPDFRAHKFDIFPAGDDRFCPMRARTPTLYSTSVAGLRT